MSWTEDQLNRLRDTMSTAKRQGAWVSAFEVGIVLGLIRFWQRATRNVAPADGMLPTIGESRMQGITHVFVDCVSYGCGNRRRLSLASLKLPDGTPFVEIGRLRRFVCHRCRCRQVTVSADWPKPKMGMG